MVAASLDSAYYIEDWFMKKGRFLAQLARKAHRIKREASFSVFQTVGDGNILSERGIPTMIFGPGDISLDHGHGVNENVLLSGLSFKVPNSQV